MTIDFDKYLQPRTLHREALHFLTDPEFSSMPIGEICLKLSSYNDTQADMFADAIKELSIIDIANFANVVWTADSWKSQPGKFESRRDIALRFIMGSYYAYLPIGKILLELSEHSDEECNLIRKEIETLSTTDILEFLRKQDSSII